MKRSASITAPIALLLVAACTVPAIPDGASEPESESDGRGDDGTTKKSADAGAKADAAAPGAEDSCPYTGPPVDTSGFPVCLGTGRCIPEGIIPEKERARLARCEDGFCVPEKIIAAQGNYLPKSCKTLGGEGRCLSRVFPDIEAQKDRLPQDVCEESERCAPCFDPLTGAETGACRTVKCDAPKGVAEPFAKCCTDRGRCVPKSIMPKEALESLERKQCEEGDLCVPEETMKEPFVPPKCTASSLIGDYSGVCISDCVKRDFLASLATAKGTCTEGHFCAPCTNPLSGEPTGAPGCP